MIFAEIAKCFDELKLRFKIGLYNRYKVDMLLFWLPENTDQHVFHMCNML